MKTKVRIKSLDKYSTFNIGDIGYIDGYVVMADDVSYPVVVTKTKIDITPFYCLEPIDTNL